MFFLRCVLGLFGPPHSFLFVLPSPFWCVRPLGSGNMYRTLLLGILFHLISRPFFFPTLVATSLQTPAFLFLPNKLYFGLVSSVFDAFLSIIPACIFLSKGFSFAAPNQFSSPSC